jgi:LAGLIDADG endonuclease
VKIHRGADNQQERLSLNVLNVSQVSPKIGHYLAGFTDGEGSFNVSFRKRGDYAMPWKVSLCFNVSQRDEVILALFKRHLKCGTMRTRPDGVWYFEVNNFTAIVENVIPFFDCFGFLSAKKQRDFAKFKQIAKLIQDGEHTTKGGIEKILAIRRDMNDGGAMRRKYSDSSITELFESRESPETARRATDDLNPLDDTVRSA